MDLAINDSTSMTMMAMKTGTMPFSTATGMLVISSEAFKPERIGIRVIKKPNVEHFITKIIISENFAEFNNRFA
ncbi:MAG: hypothetical protein V1753_11525, partial [Pseudomonadota bacterium]